MTNSTRLFLLCMVVCMTLCGVFLMTGIHHVNAQDAPSETLTFDSKDEGVTNVKNAPPMDTDHDSSIDIGDKAPDFTLPNMDGEPRTLYDILQNGPVVLSFYRGGWCPYCNDQLYGYQQILPEFEELGAQLVAISPETPQSAQDTAVKNEVTFEVLSDEGNVVTRQYDLLWTVPEDKRDRFSDWLKGETGKTLAEFNGVGKYELPIPATFVIAQNGTVVYVFKDEDYKMRADNDAILTALENLHAQREGSQQSD